MRGTVAMLTVTACIAFFTDIGILSNFFTISTLFIFMVAVVTQLILRYLMVSV
jgi:APA family basic amino acid/polyamine antiporter